jgi:uncharacterized repeat protein (TIGR01451 family)
MRTQIQTKTWEMVRRTTRQILPVAVLSLGAAALLPLQDVSAAQGWGPERPTYTWANPADHVTFNSITDNDRIGDERNFVRIRKTTESTFVDEVDLEVGGEYQVMVFFHNNADASLNKKENNYVGIAEQVRMRIAMPSELTANSYATIKGIITAKNSSPESVWDEAYAKTKKKVLLRYVQGSAVIHSEGDVNGSAIDATAMFGDYGVWLGYKKSQWGVLPGCSQYSGYVTFNFKVDEVNFKMDKEASKDNKETYSGGTLTVAPGENIDFRINYENTGTLDQTAVVFHDVLPNGLNYVANSASYTASYKPNDGKISMGAAGADIFSNGVNLGNTVAKDKLSVYYKVKVADDKTIFPCGDTPVYNNASVVTPNGTGTDKVKIVVHRECTPDIDFKKTVSIDGMNEYGKSAKIVPAGKNLDFKIVYKNTGEVEQKNVIIADVLPAGLKYIVSTTFVKRSTEEQGKFVDDGLFNGGINVGNVKPGESVTVTYKVESIDDKKTFPCGEKKIYNNASAKSTNEDTRTDKVEIVVYRDCPDIPHTGATEIVLALVVVSGLGIGTAYYVTSRKQLKKLMAPKN